ncbi:hypothetical protein PDE_09404 [Penicillium oxalicum 114-2]|uniref:Glycosyl transferase family 3 domain-containing protein n=1 Tax=Penicillium oxalicum (strain 114-2 / CGMCC 5302) TaxID=933388 RepID=S7ZUP9_PENO1|nr:hypothetical protein PDE_09404 [Penicillium oxalicum 114-2]
MAISESSQNAGPVSITSILKRLAYPVSADAQVSAEEIASVFALIFENRLGEVQMAGFLTLLHSTGKDKESDVIAKCAQRMRETTCQIERAPLERVIKLRGRPEGNYKGGLCDIVGTGGDSHSTFNISTTSSILASPLLMSAKHGNRASTSLSGAADILNVIEPISPKISAINTGNVAKVYEETNYAFLFAPNFYPGMAYASSVRRDLGLRTIFNLMGPLANPVEWALEARVVGVAYQSLGSVFAEALRQSGARKALVVCGEEDLDEISCAGKTNCWRLSEDPSPSLDAPSEGGSGDDGKQIPQTPVKLETFQLHPSDFGLPVYPLTAVHGRKMPEDNAAMLMRILRNELPRDDPLLAFVLINVAALLVTSGICEANSSDMGSGDDGQVITERGPGGGRWKEGVRRARWAVESGEALRNFQKFIEVTNKLD